MSRLRSAGAVDLVSTTWRGFYLVDLAVLFSVPVLLAGVFLLPVGTRESLVFEYTAPTLATAVSSSFVHLSPAHLLVNVVGYSLVVPAAYLLSVASGRRVRFFVVFGTFLLVFPSVLSYLTLAVARPGAGVGFSGVVMAFVGYLPLALASYLEERADVGSSGTLGPIFFFLGIGLIAGLSVQSVERDRATVLLGTSGLILTALLSALLYWLSASVEPGTVVQKLRAMARHSGAAELLGFAGVLFVVFLFVAFPSDVGSGTTVVNVYVHLLGYALGFISTYATVELGLALPSEGRTI